jgi:lysozyme
MAPTNVTDALKRDEGLRLSPYKDTRGFTTIYYGHNLDANPLPAAVIAAGDEATATVVLLADIARIQAKLFKDLPWIQRLPLVIQGVLINMAFNMGVAGEETFHHMLADVQAGNYTQAATDMKASLWYTQVGVRAQRLTQQMLTQQWV